MTEDANRSDRVSRSCPCSTYPPKVHVGVPRQEPDQLAAAMLCTWCCRIAVLEVAKELGRATAANLCRKTWDDRTFALKGRAGYGR